MRQRLILHIGTHKTGSSSLQTCLYLNRLWLRQVGIFYPRPPDARWFRDLSHRDLRDTALHEGRPRTACIHPALGPFADRLDAYRDAIRRSRAPVSVLSCEGWSLRENLCAPRLATLAQDFDVVVVAVVRRPDLWLESFYRQRLANRAHRETRDFFAYAASPQVRDYLTGRARMLGWWAEQFGPDRLRVVPYAPASPGFTVAGAVLAAGGVAPRLARRLPFATLRVNRTISREAAEAIRAAHAAGRRLTPAAHRRLRHLPGGRHYLGTAARARLLEEAAEDMAALARLVGDGRRVLFPTPPEVEPDQPCDWRPDGLSPPAPTPSATRG